MLQKTEPQKEFVEQKNWRFRGHPQIQGIPRWWFQICFIFNHYLGEDYHFDEHIFQMGWNHQLVVGFLVEWLFVLYPLFFGTTIEIHYLSWKKMVRIQFFWSRKGKFHHHPDRWKRSGFSPRWCLKSFVWDLWVTRWVGIFCFCKMFYGFKLDLNKSFPMHSIFWEILINPLSMKMDHVFSSFGLVCLVGNFMGYWGVVPHVPPFVRWWWSDYEGSDHDYWVGGQPKEWHVGVRGLGLGRTLVRLFKVSFFSHSMVVDSCQLGFLRWRLFKVTGWINKNGVVTV